jgi:hypothetical protein
MNTIKRFFKKLFNLILTAIGWTLGLFALFYFTLHMIVAFAPELRLLKEAIKQGAIGLFNS